MKYSQYPSYKDSGVEWLGDIPEGWSSVSMKWISKIFSGGTPDKSNIKFWENGDVPWINSGAVNQFYISKPSTYITKEAYLNSSAKWIKNHSLVMALAGQGKTKGMVAQLAITSTCNQSMAAIEPYNSYTPRLLLWWLTSNYQRIRNMAGGDLRDGLNLDLLGNISCPKMSVNEQKAIANYLDKATAKIDTLIAKQTRLIALLKEKRQAVISTAVTRGLDSTVAMKDSGVAWLGEIPEHWVTPKLKLFISTTKGFAFQSNDFVDEGVPLVKMSEIKNGSINKSSYFLPKEFQLSHKQVLLKYKDIIISTVGSAPEVKNSAVGQIGIVPERHEGSLLNQNTVVFSPNRKLLDNDYLPYILKSQSYREHLDLHAHGTANQASLNLTDMLKFVFPLPTLQEQQAITNYIDEKTIKIETLISKSTQAIDLLKEKRIALISSAVTGKIDVRETL